MGCDSATQLAIVSSISFNPRTRMGCDNVFTPIGVSHSVSIHAPAWGATAVEVLPVFTYVFQSTHPHGVRQLMNLIINASSCFNPRTRMGCDQNGISGISLFNVSIHAPAWGATTQNHYVQSDKRVSIHAPAWGATYHHTSHTGVPHVSIHAPAWGATMCEARKCLYKEFQSTHPHGVRRVKVNVWRKGFAVSIHAPAWGATSVTLPIYGERGGFNPRTRMGCDHSACV